MKMSQYVFQVILFLGLSTSWLIAGGSDASLAFRFKGIEDYRETRIQRYMESLGTKNQGEIIFLLLEELKPKSKAELILKWRSDGQREEFSKVPLVEQLPVDELITATGGVTSLGVFFSRIPVGAGDLEIEVVGFNTQARFSVRVLPGRMSAVVHAWDRFGKRALDSKIIGSLQDQIRLKLYPFQSFIEQVVAKPVPPKEGKILVNLTYPKNEISPINFAGARLKNEVGEFEALKIQPKKEEALRDKCSRVEIFFEVPSESNDACFDLILELDDPSAGRDLSHGKNLLCWGRTQPRRAMIGHLNLKRTFGAHYQIHAVNKLDNPCSIE